MDAPSNPDELGPDDRDPVLIAEAVRRGKIEVRRFAGHVQHADRLTRPVRIAHLTDQHFGRVTPHRIQQLAIELAIAEQPDLVVLTGDFIAHSHDYLDALEELTNTFGAPVFAVLGNHDHWSGADEVRHILRRGGAEVLDNVNTTITVGHEQIQVVGLDDAYTGHADVERATKGMRHDLPTIGLSHIAEEADGLWKRGVPLVLSGHTHAGQITVAKLHEISLGKLGGHRYIHGLYGDRVAHGAVYVGAGIGASVMPLRLGERGKREVTIFELGHAPGTLEEHHAEQPALPGRKPTEKLRQKRKEAAQKKAARRKKKREKKNGKDG